LDSIIDAKDREDPWVIGARLGLSKSLVVRVSRTPELYQRRIDKRRVPKPLPLADRCPGCGWRVTTWPCLNCMTTGLKTIKPPR
jgi:hypothetical protein